MYLGLAAAGAGGFYLYRAGGDPQKAKDKMQKDVEEARRKLPKGDEARAAGEKVGEEASDYIDQIVKSAQDKARNGSPGTIEEYTKDSINKIDQVRQDTAKKLGVTVDKLDRKVEDKAAEAKSTVSSWFGGSK
ncbi:hypothetical protein VTN49DRAFT_1243 [Thermomyces lanuginosus]|uniref:uncharacterized protein n=1 Tax=Thermomyces lanuginosus TaxID=5541 RepID=UPI0037420411